MTRGAERIGNKEKETLQHCCRGELTGKEETSEGNSAPGLCSNEAKVTNRRVTRAVARALLRLETSAASAACRTVGNTRQTFWCMPPVTLLKTLRVPSQRDNGRKGYNKIKWTFHINRLGRRNVRFDKAKFTGRFQEQERERKEKQLLVAAVQSCWTLQKQNVKSRH